MSLRWLSLTVIAGALLGCQSVRSPDNVAPEQSISSLTYDELGLIRADSELFEGVVRAQLAGTKKEHPYHLDSLRFDARPYGSDSALPVGSLGFEKSDSSFPSQVRPEVIARLVGNRKLILSALAVQEGGPRHYSPCAGLLVVPVVPLGDSVTSAKKLAELRAGCPKADAYLTVSLPIHGMPEDVRKAAIRIRKPLQLDGEFLTALVDGKYAGPSGSMWDEYAWLFQRDPSTGRLKLATTLLIGIAE